MPVSLLNNYFFVSGGQYLAANRRMPRSIADRLKRAAKELGYR